MRSDPSARIISIGLLVGLWVGLWAASPALAQWASDWTQVNLDANFLGPDALVEPNAVLIADHTWQAYAETTNLNGAVFTWVGLGTETVWGDTDQADTTIPLAGIAEITTNSMSITGELPRYTRFRFNAETGAYSVDDVTPAPLPAVWINEIDYNNPGTDTTEWIELAGASGVSLDDFELALINQVGSEYAVFDLADAAFVFPDEADGFGFFVLGIVPPSLGVMADYVPAGWTSDEIQNGPGDSIQLRRKEGENVHLVDYGGDNAATDEDQTAAADGAANDSDTIYLAGINGGDFDGFTWQNQADRATPGAANVSQTFEALPGPFASVTLSNPLTEPASPGDSDPVHIFVDAEPQFEATGLTLTAFYRTDTNESFAPIPMMADSGDTFVTSDPVPAQPLGAQVEYYVFAVFDGAGTHSPVQLGSAEAPMRYGIARFPNGSIWINELNAEGYFSVDTNEFIELAGPAGGDISGWRLDLYGATTNAYASYSLPAGSTLTGSGGGEFGFFVLGDEPVPDVDLVFTHAGGGDNQLANSGAIRLSNELGIEQYLLAYGEFAPTNVFPDAEWIGYEDFFSFDDDHLALSGSAGSYAGFTWVVETSGSPGAANASQTLIGGNGGDPSSVEILDLMVSGSSVTILSTGTNTWTVRAEFTTHLPSGEPGWTPIAGARSRYSDGIHTTIFTTPSPMPAVQFRIRQTPP